MARIDVIMPQMGESIAEGTLSKWLKKVGDEVKRDEPIFEISTDKVDAEIPSPSAGVLAEVIVTEGQTVAVQTVVARIETEKGAAIGAAPTPASASGSAGAAGGGPATPMADGASPKSLASTGRPSAPPAAGPPPRSQHDTAGTAPHHPQPAPAAKFTASPSGNSLEDRLRTRSSPLVRKIAAEHGIELATLQGTGIAGRVTRKDIMSVVESGVPETGSPRAPGQPVGAHAPQAWPGDVVEPMSRMRAIISEHMVAARRTAAHVTSFFEIDLTRVARIRAKKRAEFEQQTGQKLTYLPFIVSAVVQSLQRYPILNSVVSGGNIIYRKQYNIGIAVALDWGLIVPVIRHAESLSLSGITRSLNDLAARARAKKLNPAEVQDATFTITNPGVFGSLMGTPIIPQPTAAILGLGAIEKRPKVITGPDGEDTIAIRTCAYFSLSFDHRVIDGAVADEFLASVKKTLENFPEQVS